MSWCPGNAISPIGTAHGPLPLSIAPTMRYAVIYCEAPARYRAQRRSPIHTKAARHGVLVHVNGLQVNEPIHADSALHCLDHQVAGAVVKRFAHSSEPDLNANAAYKSVRLRRLTLPTAVQPTLGRSGQCHPYAKRRRRPAPPAGRPRRSRALRVPAAAGPSAARHSPAPE